MGAGTPRTPYYGCRNPKNPIQWGQNPIQWVQEPHSPTPWVQPHPTEHDQGTQGLPAALTPLQ